MQAQIRRTPVGHYILHCSLDAAEGSALPGHWTHIELDLGHLRILCALPEHPRQQDCALADARLSCWLRARVHAGKLAVHQTVTLDPVYEGVYRVQACPETAQTPSAEAPSVEVPVAAPLAGSLPLESPSVTPLAEARPRPQVAPRLLPRPVRHTARQAARPLAAQAS